jgi:hypothetical protein
MRINRAAAVTLAALALTIVSACKETSTGPGVVACVAADPVCPDGTLDLGFTGATGTPSIVPGTAGTTFSQSGSAYVLTGTTTATAFGYWLLVTNDVLSSWGVLAVTGGVYGAEIPLFCGAQRIYLTFNSAAGRSYYAFDMNRTGCTTTHAAFRVQLTWTSQTYSDLDLHLLRPGGAMFSDNDCYYGNCDTYDAPTGLEWGATGAAGNPSLDVDDTEGYGPENIYLTSGAETGQYRIIIDDYDGTAGEIATVRIYLNDVEVRRYVSHAMDGGASKFWEVAKVNILTGAISDVGTYSSSAPVTLGAPPAWAPIAK